MHTGASLTPELVLSESNHDTCGNTPIAFVRYSIRTKQQPVCLHEPHCDVLADSHIQPTSQRRGERVGRYAIARRMSHAEQRVSEGRHGLRLAEREHGASHYGM